MSHHRGTSEPEADELTLTRALGDELSPRGAPAPEALTARVLTGLRTPTGPSRPVAGPARWRGRRPALWLLPVAAAATSAMVLTGVVPGLPDDPEDPPSPAARGTQGDDPSDPSTAVRLDARSVLLAAATRARSRPGNAPAAQRYAYTRVLETIDQVNMDRTSSWDRETLDYWLPVDGRRNGWIRGVRRVSSTSPAGHPGYPSGLFDAFDPCPGPADSDPVDVPLTYCPGPGYVADFPTDPDGALAFLKQGRRWNDWYPFSDRPGDTAEDHFVIGNLTELYKAHHLPPGGWAAVYEALAGLPEATLADGVKTAGGRTGVAVVMEYAVFEREDDSFKGRYEFVFDPSTYDLIGINDIEEGDAESTPLIITRTEVQRSAVVDAPGLYPDGTKVTKIEGRRK